MTEMNTPPPSSFSSLLSLPYLCRHCSPSGCTVTTDPILHGTMVNHYGISTPPLAQGQSKVSHKLRLSQQEEVKLRIIQSALFVACLTGLLVLVNAVAPPEGFPEPPRNDYRSRGALVGSDKSPLVPFSTSWACYSPYHPVGKYEGSTGEGCVVSQVNIVSSVPALIDLTADPLPYVTDTIVSNSSNAMVPGTQLPE